MCHCDSMAVALICDADEGITSRHPPMLIDDPIVKIIDAALCNLCGAFADKCVLPV